MNMKLIKRLEWTEQASCTGGGDVWFLSGKEFHEEIEAAIDVCWSRPVAGECLTYAMEIEQGASQSYRFGIWGGLTPRQRVKLDRAHVKEAA